MHSAGTRRPDDAAAVGRHRGHCGGDGESVRIQVRVVRPVAEVWFNGNRQLYFLVEQTGGEFGTGTGEEFGEYDPLSGTYHPMWMPIIDLLQNPVYPVEVALLVMESQKDGWPREPVTIYEEPR